MASQLHCSNPVSERSMRSFYCGKIKTLQFNDKKYAPNQVLKATTKEF